MDLKDNEVLTPPCRLAVASLFAPTPKHPTTPTEVRYQATVLIPPGLDMTPFSKAINAAMVEKWGKTIPLEGRAMPLKKADGKTTQDGRPYSGFEPGWFTLKAMNRYAPQIVDQAKRPILDVAANADEDAIARATSAAEARVYSGCWCRFYVRAFAWDNASGKGVSFSLEAVQLVKDDEAFAGKKQASDLFETIDTGDAGPPADGEVEGGDPLAGLLG